MAATQLPNRAVVDKPLYHHIDQPSTITRDHSYLGPEQPSARAYEDELGKLSRAFGGLEAKHLATRDKGGQQDGRSANSEMGVLEKAIGYIRHLQEQEKALEQESETLRTKLTFWTG
ncbi:hypothetical protein BKA61DRAFT_571553 [Leptodontidium sp. MPI-SDFR-AT-0119]|nr:hypothetical protein BKA61DRAFT_571553 [Leptodontidium sp. MPI-SDFR-AT-0119]